MTTHPEWALWDVDSAPGHHHSVFEWFARGVAAAVCSITVVLHLHIHWVSITVLRRKKYVSALIESDESVIRHKAGSTPELESLEELCHLVWHPQ